MAASITTEQQSQVEQQSLRRRVTSLAFIQSRLRRLSSISSESRAADDAKGPLGLTLLHEPSEPRIDIIFVHGLFGGSRKTWSHDPSQPGTFWPKEWLPNEIGFKHVRLHTYGYDSGGSRKQSSLGVHDFGQALIADIHNSPSLRKNDDTPIIFVAHSMGGLVVKKAYLIANLDPTYKALARRIQTLFFLGTPHRGADAAQALRMARHLTGYAPKAYIDDLVPGGATLNQINEEFRHVCNNLHLWSFFEGVPTSFGSVVVEKESSVLGLPGEQIQHLEADHRSICKFETPVCPNYLILQRALVTAIEQLEADCSVQRRRDQYKDQMERISTFLQVEQGPEDLLLAITEKQHQGSCQWLTEDGTFQHWATSSDGWDTGNPLQNTTDASKMNARILWLTGRPGTGKSVASAHVARYLESCNLDCSFYFFRHNDQPAATVSALLRSLAFQMAQSSCEVRRAILTLIEDGTRVNHGDHHTLWSKLFVDRIFKLESLRPQFWVIDAIDECPSSTISALVSLLSRLDHMMPLRVFLTSRPGGQLERLLAQEKVPFNELTTGQAGSLRDIESYLLARCPRIRDAEFDKNVLADVLSKSNGIFLWASLTMARLDEAYSVEDMLEILQTVPSEMDGFYSCIADSILASPNKDLATCILRWVICSPNILTAAELAEAVKVDIGRTLTASPKQLETITGHLVFVDSQSRVHIAHETTSRYLTEQRDGLAIDLKVAHSRVAEICLGILCGNEFTPPRRRRPVGFAAKTTRSLFGSYAATHLGHHLKHSPPSDKLLVRIAKFLRSNVLTWIERLAESGSLSVLQQSSRRLKEYASRGRDQLDGKAHEVHQSVTAWAKDIHHLVAGFHPSLLASPSSIHFIIPYFCPNGSMIRQLARPNKRLRTVGFEYDDWSEKLASYHYYNVTSSVTSCNRLLAIGFDNGDIKLYNIAGVGTFEPIGTLTHSGRLEGLVFDALSTRLVSCGYGKVMLWDVSQPRAPSFPCLWAQDLGFEPEHLGFDGEGERVLVADLKKSSLASFRVVDGSRAEDLVIQSPDGDGGSWCPPEHIQVCPDQNLAAVSYYSSPVIIWDLETMTKIGRFVRDGHGKGLSPSALNMIFNPAADVELLAISYGDYEVVLCNPWTLEQIATQQVPQLMITLASSLDGRILGGLTLDGVIILFRFEDLQPIFRVQPPQHSYGLGGLSFAPDGLSFFEVQKLCCNIWEPLVLAEHDATDVDGAIVQTRMEGAPLEKLPPISASGFKQLACIHTIQGTQHGVCLVGRSEGMVEACDTKTGAVLGSLQLHSPNSFAQIRVMEWDEASNSMLSFISEIEFFLCIVTRVSFNTEATEVSFKRLMGTRSAHFRQALLSPGATSLLLRKESTLTLFDMERRSVARVTSLSARYCVTHPTNPSILIAFQTEPTLRLLDWASLDILSPAGGIELVSDQLPDGLVTSPDLLWYSHPGSPYMARCVPSANAGAPSYFVAFDASKLTPKSTEIELQVWRVPSHLGLPVRAVAGIRGSALYFQDATGWVCSVELGRLGRLEYYTRHFFIPPTWQMGTRAPVITMVSDTAVALSRGEKLVVMEGFLEFEERVMVGEGKRDGVVDNGR